MAQRVRHAGWHAYIPEEEYAAVPLDALEALWQHVDGAGSTVVRRAIAWFADRIRVEEADGDEPRFRRPDQPLLVHAESRDFVVRGVDPDDLDRIKRHVHEAELGGDVRVTTSQAVLRALEAWRASFEDGTRAPPEVPVHAPPVTWRPPEVVDPVGADEMRPVLEALEAELYEAATALAEVVSRCGDAREADARSGE